MHSPHLCFGLVRWGLPLLPQSHTPLPIPHCHGRSGSGPPEDPNSQESLGPDEMSPRVAREFTAAVTEPLSKAQFRSRGSQVKSLVRRKKVTAHLLGRIESVTRGTTSMSVSPLCWSRIMEQIILEVTLKHTFQCVTTLCVKSCLLRTNLNLPCLT